MSVTEDDLANALSAWGEGMVSISSAYRQSGYEDARHVAKKIIGDLYGYSMGSVLFKPTLSGGAHTFRTSEEGALSYFVGATPVTLMIVDLQLKVGERLSLIPRQSFWMKT